MSDCIFCKIANGEIPSKKLYENNSVFAINDINPKAPKHILVITKKHIEKYADLDDKKILANIHLAIKEIIAKEKIENFKIHINNGKKAGQEVMHLHIHILGY